MTMDFQPLPMSLTATDIQKKAMQQNSPISMPGVQNTGASDFMSLSNLIPALDALGGLTNAFLGFKNYGLAKDQFNFQKDAFTQQFNQQAGDMNRQLEDRQRARLGANPNGYQSVSQYMNQNKVQNYGG